MSDNFSIQSFIQKTRNKDYEASKGSKKNPKVLRRDLKENYQALPGERIEGLLHIELKREFLAAFMRLYENLIEDDDMFELEDVIAHLANEMENEVNTNSSEWNQVNEVEEEEIDTPEEEVELDIPEEDIELASPGESADSKEIFSKLVDAYEAAKTLGDDKLTRQLANTITYFNKSVIFGDI